MGRWGGAGGWGSGSRNGADPWALAVRCWGRMSPAVMGQVLKKLGEIERIFPGTTVSCIVNAQGNIV